MDIPCSKCRGKGRIPLPDELERTYRAVKSGLSTTEEIYAADKQRRFMGRTAINQRLERLFQLGLLSRQRQGKFIHFRISK